MFDSPFALKIGLKDEREFKRAITKINREMRVLGSEMKLMRPSSGKTPPARASAVGVSRYGCAGIYRNSKAIILPPGAKAEGRETKKF